MDKLNIVDLAKFREEAHMINVYVYVYIYVAEIELEQQRQ